MPHLDPDLLGIKAFDRKVRATLPPMKFKIGDEVAFDFSVADEEPDTYVGKVVVADFGGSFEHDFHSYDVEVPGVGRFKHIVEDQLREPTPEDRN